MKFQYKSNITWSWANGCPKAGRGHRRTRPTRCSRGPTRPTSYGSLHCHKWTFCSRYCHWFVQKHEWRRSSSSKQQQNLWTFSSYFFSLVLLVLLLLLCVCPSDFGFCFKVDNWSESFLLWDTTFRKLYRPPPTPLAAIGRSSFHIFSRKKARENNLIPNQTSLIKKIISSSCLDRVFETP
jgi:hypothetical protein